MLSIAHEKQLLFEEVAAELMRQGLSVASADQNRPWGGFFVIDESQPQRFANVYFSEISAEQLQIAGRPVSSVFAALLDLKKVDGGCQWLFA